MTEVTLSRHLSRPLAAALLAAAVPASAITPCEKPVFACTMQTSGKQVQVCQRNQQLVYEFGAPQQEAELRFERRIDAVTFAPWNGMGTTYWSSMEMANGAWTYRLSVSYERGDPAAQGSAGITLLRDGKQVRHLACVPETVRERMEDLAP